MLTMDQIHHIRQLYFEQDKNISEIARELHINWRTVRKYVDMTDFNPPVPKPETDLPACPKLDPYKLLIDLWLQEDKKAPRKQRHTARRIYDRLKDETEDSTVPIAWSRNTSGTKRNNCTLTTEIRENFH